MPRVEFVTSSVSDDDNIAANPARLINLYASAVPDQGRTRYALKSVLGQEAKDDIGTAPVRAMSEADGANWLAGDGKFFEVGSDGTVTQRAVIADDAETTIAGGYGFKTIVSGNNYYTWDGSTLTQPTGKTFANVGSHCYIGGYTVLTEADGLRFQWSSIGDPNSLDALDFASANQVSDDIIRPVEFGGYLLLMCERSTEIWSVDPDASDAAARFVYADLTNTGLKAHNLLVRFDDALFFIGNDNRAYIFGQGVVSDGAVETSLSQSAPTHCFYYEDEGNKFCVVRFSDRPAWVFDMTTRMWHERSESAGHTAWRATASVRNGATWLVGNVDGEILELARTNKDLSGPLYRRAIARTLYPGGHEFVVDELEFVGRMGDHMLDAEIENVLALSSGGALAIGGSDGVLGLTNTPAGERDAFVDLYESEDGGRTWFGPFTRSMGRNGDYRKRLTWDSRGQFLQYTARLDLSEPADLTLYADGELTAQ